MPFLRSSNRAWRVHKVTLAERQSFDNTTLLASTKEAVKSHNVERLQKLLGEDTQTPNEP